MLPVNSNAFCIVLGISVINSDTSLAMKISEPGSTDDEVTRCGLCLTLMRICRVALEYLPGPIALAVTMKDGVVALLLA